MFDEAAEIGDERLELFTPCPAGFAAWRCTQRRPRVGSNNLLMHGESPTAVGARLRVLHARLEGLRRWLHATRPPELARLLLFQGASTKFPQGAN